MTNVKDYQFRKYSQKRKAAHIVTRICTFVLTTLSLLFMVCLYAIIGGFVFQWLEASSEQQQKQSAREKVHALTQQYSSDIYQKLEKLKRSETSQNAKKAVLTFLETKVQNFTIDTFKLSKEGFWDGTFEDDGDIVLDWTYTGALLFSVTTITTIGYGTIAPKTTTGRITCIFYSILGTPITMLCIANIGLWFAKQVRLMHKKLSARCRKSTTSQVQEVPVLFSLLTMIAYVFLGTGIFSTWENWSITDGTYFCFITLTTIGFGDIVPDVYTGKGEWSEAGSSSKKQIKLIVCAFYLFFGLALLAMCMDLMKEEVRANFLWLGQKAGLGKKTKPEKTE